MQLLFFVLCQQCFGQYWFGPKVGGSYINHVYSDKTYENDTFAISNNFNVQAGLALSYTATDRYAVYGELLYERIGKKLRDIPTAGSFVTSQTTNHFITVPIMLRITLGTLPFHYYVNGGPRINYWVAGNGVLEAGFDEFTEFVSEDGEAVIIDYNITFNENKVSADDRSNALVSDPNRVQFGLTAGGGMLLDLATGGRLMLDLRLSWIHSNMASNRDGDVNLVYDSYRENLAYYHQITSVSVGYLFGYNSQLRRKGKSTNKRSNKKKK